MVTKELPFVKKELNVMVFNPTNLPTTDYHKLSILQGSLKTLSERNRTKLCKSIQTNGFFVPAFVWKSGEDMYILDATQRYHALEELERKGYSIPAIPYIEIEAKDKKDAARKLLQITSRYGEINTETSFFADFDIEIDYLKDIAIPELDLTFEDLNSKEIIEDEIPEVLEEAITQVGDLWLLGKHRVLCGDATKADDVERLLNKKNPLYTLYPSSKMDISGMVNDNNHKTDKNSKHIVFFSGGKDSTAMLLMMIDKKMKIDDIVCVSLGNWEWKETIEHIEKIKIKMKKLNIKFTHKIVFDLDQVVQEKGFPNQFQRWCTSKKLDEFKKYLKTSYSDGNYVEYVGISFDEKIRALKKGYKNVRFPLIEWAITGEDALKYSIEKGYNWDGLYNETNSVGCWCCPLQRISTIRNLRDNHKQKWDHLLSMQRQSQQSFRLGYNSLFFLEHRFWLEDFNYIYRDETKINYMRNHSDKEIIKYTKEAIEKNTKEGGLVLDLFGGNGSTLIVCETIDRICYMMEEDPSNVDIVCQRFLNLFEIDPVRESDSKKWSELKGI